MASAVHSRRRRQTTVGSTASGGADLLIPASSLPPSEVLFELWGMT